ncbi:MAG TPA: acetate--CoA ligase family protein [Casimicrobiaceae bacterium]
MSLPFGELSPLLAARSVAVVGASDREGNLGGTAIGFLKKFRYAGPVWPINPGRATVGGLACFPSLRELPAVPDLAILAVPAGSIVDVVKECVDAGVRAAVAWAGGFAEAGDACRARQRELEAVCRDSGIKLCGPNCIGIINTATGLTASFSTMLAENDRLTPGVVSMVSQSGGIGVMAHARAQAFGLGFRVTVSCGNEAVLGVPDFMRALAQDDGTRVIAIYTEGLSNPDAFVDALAEARRRGKPVVILKGGATEASGRAALAHTGRLAGADRTYDAIFREFAAIRVYSTEELLDVCLQLASMRPDQLPQGDRVLLTSFGGGSGVICTDQCGREGLAVPPLDDATRARVAPLLTPLSSAINPIDLTPAMMTQPAHRARLPEAIDVLEDAPGFDSWLFLAAGFGSLAPALADIYDRARQASKKPMCLTWQAAPAGIRENLAARGIYTFTEHARAVRALGHIVRHADDLRHTINKSPVAPSAFPWDEFVTPAMGASGVVSEDVVARILEAANLPVARGRIAASREDAVPIAGEVGFPVAIKTISPAITHRAAAGLVALNVDSPDAVAATDARFRARAAALGAPLDGLWIQHMFDGQRELIVTALADAEFGVIVGVGIGGSMTEVIDDVAFARAPIDATGAADLLTRLKTLRRLPAYLSDRQCDLAADFVARFSALAATAPWPRFTLEVNPLKLGEDAAAAVDGLLLIEPSQVTTNIN